MAECNDSKCRYYFNKLKKSIANSASFMRQSAHKAALALVNRTAPHDVTPAISVTPEHSAKPEHSATHATPVRMPLPHVKMYPQISEYDQC